MKSAVMIGALGGLWLAVATHQPPRPLPRTGQQAPPKEVPAPQQAAPKPESPKLAVIVPFFGNDHCPVDGQPTDHERWLEVEGQRVYVCSAACFETTKLDALKALEKAYPELKPVATKGCAVCNVVPEAGKEPANAAARDLSFQGRTVRLCSAECEKAFRLAPSVWLARITWPEVKDAGNLLCPIDDQKIDGVTVVICKSTLVRLSSPACAARFEKNPEAALAKVKAGG